MAEVGPRKRSFEDTMTLVPQSLSGLLGLFKRPRSDDTVPTPSSSSVPSDIIDLVHDYPSDASTLSAAGSKNEFFRREEVGLNSLAGSSTRRQSLYDSKLIRRQSGLSNTSVVQNTQTDAELLKQRINDLAQNKFSFVPSLRQAAPVLFQSRYNMSGPELVTSLRKGRPTRSVQPGPKQYPSRRYTPSSNEPTSFSPANTPKYEELHRKKEELLAKARLLFSEMDKKETEIHAAVEPLDASKMEVVSYYWHKVQPRTKIIGEAFRVELQVNDLRTLMEGQWLNDNVIDMYLAGVTANVDKSVKTFIFTTHFFTRLTETGYSAVGKWARRKKVMVKDLDYLLVPVNRSNMHWCLAVVNNREKRFEYYDSLGAPGQDAIDALVDYMIQESDSREPGKHEEHTNLYLSYEQVPRAKSPAQKNGYDCGAFMCQNAKALSTGSRPTFTQNDMLAIRQNMAYNLLEYMGKNKVEARL